MTPEERRRLVEILSANVGFEDPESWVEFASTHGFRRVPAIKLTRCPDCGSQPGRSYGQYVYYSTLLHLVNCDTCGLIWVDARLDDSTIRQHFESAYKDPSYFAKQRRPIFQEIAALIDARTPHGGSVLDIGGATGELLAMVQKRRADVRPVLNDLSQLACEQASARLGIETRCCDLLSLRSAAIRYDTVVCSDVLYYETQIDRVWPTLRQLVRPNGTLIVRLPNKARAITGGALWRDATSGFGDRGAGSNIAFFNPEHLYVFRRAYVERRLRESGFANVQAYPSHPLGGGVLKTVLARALYGGAAAIYRLSLGQLVVTPSMLVTATGERDVGR